MCWATMEMNVKILEGDVILWCIGVNTLEECIASIIFDPENGGSTFLQNIGTYLPNNTASTSKKTTELVLHSSPGIS